MKRCGKILIGIISIFLIITIPFLIYNNFENKNNKITDAEKFKNEYPNVSEDNVFTYSTTTEVINILKNGTGVVFLGFPSCKWCQEYVTLLNEIAKENGIDKIYYLDILNDRTNNTKNYQTITKLLNGNLLCDDEGNKKIYTPDVTIVKNGKIIGHDNESSVITVCGITPEDYWTTEKKDALRTKLTLYFKELTE